MYDQIISFEEYAKLSDEDKKKHLIEYKKRFTKADIARGLGIEPHKVYYEFDKYVNQKKKGRSAAPINRVEAEPKRTDNSDTLITNGFVISFGGDFTGEELQSKIEKLALILENNSNYQAIIQIKEMN